MEVIEPKLKQQDKLIFIGITIVNLVLVFLNQSTFDSGDSILHYLQSRQAFVTPEFFLDHWAKPVFVLLSSPFTAIGGWFGMKLFNTLCVTFSCLTVYFLFKEYKLPVWWGVFICYFAHHFFLIQSSGLTEPLFALLLVQIVYWSFKERYILALVILSFLPMVRSEGWVIMLIYTVFLLAQKRIKYIPYIAVGTVFYSLLGLIYKGNFLWLFNENPYSGIEETYGSGNIMHYMEQLPYVIGLPIFILFLLGIFWVGRMVLKGMVKNHEFFLIYGITIGYIVAHSIWWHMGWFHSFGMNRVLLVLVPLIAFIAFRGLEQFECSFYFLKAKYSRWVWIAFIAIFPFLNNPMSMHTDATLRLQGNQVLAEEMVDWLMDNGYENEDWYTSNFHLLLASDKKLNLPSEGYSLDELNRHKARKGSLIIWDSYFAERDALFTLQRVEQMKIKPIKSFKGTYKNREYHLKAFEVLDNN